MDHQPLNASRLTTLSLFQSQFAFSLHLPPVTSTCKQTIKITLTNSMDDETLLELKNDFNIFLEIWKINRSDKINSESEFGGHQESLVPRAFRINRLLLYCTG